MREAIIEFWPDSEKPTLDQVKNPDWLLRHSRERTPGAALVELFERHVEDQLFDPTIIYDYPAEVSPLSKNKPDEPEFVERFEIYIAGIEIANAFTELNDPQEQRRRFELQLARKEGGDQEAQYLVCRLLDGMPRTLDHRAAPSLER